MTRDDLTPQNREYIDRVAEYRKQVQARKAPFGTKVGYHSWEEPASAEPDPFKGVPLDLIGALDREFADESTIETAKAIRRLQAANLDRAKEPEVPENLPGADQKPPWYIYDRDIGE